MRLDHLLSMENVVNVQKTLTGRRSDSSKFVVQFSVTESKIVVGATNAQGPPVPIPNTEVKLCSAENTSTETSREDRSAPTPRKGKPREWQLHGGVAQLGEHLPCKQGVMGSNPIISTSRASDEGIR